MLDIFENQAKALGYNYTVGIDEAGRGPLAGPVVVCACHIPLGISVDGVKDSKQLTSFRREELYHQITENDKITYGIGIVNSNEIDALNILRATLQGMVLAIRNTNLDVDYLLVDGNQYPIISIPGLAIVQGEDRSQSIAAASIIAKYTRDNLMADYHKKWPQYGFDKHKGYGTKDHILAVKNHGPSPIHRLSFEPIKSLVSNLEVTEGV